MRAMPGRGRPAAPAPGDPIELADLVLEDPAGRSVPLGDLVDRPAVIDLVRYYGCAPCVSQLHRLADRHDEVVAAGGMVVGIGPAAPYQARLLEGHGIPFPLLLDPDRLVATRIGLGRQTLTRYLLDPRGWVRWLTSWFHGGRQGRITAGHAELPAIVVVDASARVTWLHRGRFIGDYPPMSETLGRLRMAVDGLA